MEHPVLLALDEDREALHILETQLVQRYVHDYRVECFQNPGPEQSEVGPYVQYHFKMFTARATTSKATISEIASSAIIISFIHGRIAETSVGLNAVAVANEKWK